MLVLIESTKIDFDDFFDFISLIKSIGRDPNIEEYQNFFYKKWKESTPLLFVKIMEDAAENDIQSAISHPENCEECYFKKICKIK